MATLKPQYQLHAYVCGNACVVRSDVDGTVPFTTVFMKRPNHCRYAIISKWEPYLGADVVLVWDLYETTEKRRSGRLIEPVPLMQCDDVDQAIMATMLLYDVNRPS